MQPSRAARIATWMTLAAYGLTSTSWAGSVDLATAPLVTGLSKVVAPNIYFIFDDSLSMPSEYMPDSVNSNSARRCYRNFGHNTVYFNPATTYNPPVDETGTAFPNATFTAAWEDGYNTGTGTTNLSNAFGTGGETANKAAYYYEYTADPTNPPSTCGLSTDTTNTARDSRYTLKTVTAAQQQNFANWYSYYRNRLLMMKTASGRAFKNLTNAYRVGFSTTSEKGTGSSKFLGIDKFEGAHRKAWYDILYATDGDFAGTPLRGALSKAGRYYAGKLVSGANDPVQYSCQQNYTILTTDGFWNLSGEASSGTKYGPYDINNSTKVGDLDSGNGIPRPLRDSLAKTNTLADVAMYYYNKDLRDTAGTGGLTDEGNYVDVSPNNVPTTTTDTATHQHMTTFTLGLGVSDVLTYPTDLTALIQGTKNWPDPSVTNTGITVTGRVDDLWHAAINGRGQYLSAKDPSAVQTQLGQVLQAIQSRTGSSSAAATSNLQPVSGDNTAFIAQYKTGEWVGDLLARLINVNSGAISTTDEWSAQALLDATTWSSRKIYTYSTAAADAATKLKLFTPANLSSEISSNYFLPDGSNPNGKLSQISNNEWTLLQEAAATSTAMINYLRGDRTNESTGGTALTDLFRKRTHILGDISNTAPVYVRKPPFRYTDTGYAAFINANASRAETVYVGSNDGMLHAFDASVGNANSGTERWAYMPKTLIPMLYRLAGSDYANNHRFYVDGPVSVGDAYNGSSWATILVGGLGGGGKGYYALDITNPASPKALWEFGTTQDSDIGYSYGNPILTKRASDGKWVVLFASGYNNTTGDKKGRLYVVDAFTGAKLSEYITDDTVNNEDVSGIARISNWVEDGLVNNSTQYVYGGDLGGSLWRFDITAGAGTFAQRLGRTTGTVGQRPITLQPELAKIRDGSGNYHRVVYFGTGRYLGLTDLDASAPSSAQQQAVYAVKDTGTDLGNLTSGGAKIVHQTLDSSVSPRVINPIAPVDWSTQNGWRVPTPVGERFTVDPGLQLGVLVIASNLPKQDYCKPTGASVLYQLDYKSGNVLMTNEYQAQIVGITQLQTAGGSGPVAIDPVFGDGTTGNAAQVGGAGGVGTATRVSWREIE